MVLRPDGSAANGAFVSVRDVRTYFYESPRPIGRMLRVARAPIRAVDGVNLEIPQGQIVGLVGESGSGKTTLGRTILGLEPATSGQILYDGRDIARAGRGELRHLRRDMQMIFQEPHASLSPRLRISYLLNEPYRIHGTPLEDRYTVPELLEMVELSSEQATKHPHELSGGQARRVGIARALALHPRFIVADEPTSGLDVSAAGSVLNLMTGLAMRLGLTYLVITHDLEVIGYIADTVAVMYLGQIVEVGPPEDIFASPTHPYTQALLEALPTPDPRRRKLERRLLLPGEIPSPKNPPPGCRFHTRCSHARSRCRLEGPPLVQIAPARRVACHFWREVKSGAPPTPAPALPEG